MLRMMLFTKENALSLEQVARGWWLTAILSSQLFQHLIRIHLLPDSVQI
jgi:hypothetical protein